MSRVLQTIEAIEARLAQIRVANGYHTDLGLRVVPSGQWLEEDDAPCVTVYEAAPGGAGEMILNYGQKTSMGIEIDLPYVIDALHPASDAIADTVLADRIVTDLLRAVDGSSLRSLPMVRGHRLLGRARRLRERGSRVLAVRLMGELRVLEEGTG